MRKLYLTDEDKEMLISVALTGYRPFKLPFGYDLNHPDALRLRAILKEQFRELIELGIRRFYTGGALGCDMMAAEVILELKKEYKFKHIDIYHWICAPCFHYTAKWKPEDRERLKEIAKKSHVHFVSQSEYFNGCMQIRNQYMVDNANVLIAIYDGQKGGTHNTIEYAKKKKRNIIIINPSTFVKMKLIETPENARFMLSEDDLPF